MLLARQHEQGVREAIQVGHDLGADWLLAPERHRAALGAPAHGARHVEVGVEARAAGEDEALQDAEPFGALAVDERLERIDARPAR